MNFVSPIAERVIQQPGIEGMLKLCEKVARVCYHSEKSITEDSYKKFLKHQEESHHMSPFEAGTIYLKFKIDSYKELTEFFKDSTYSFVALSEGFAYVTTNYRHIIEEDLKDFMYDTWTEPTEYHIPRICIKAETCIEVYKDLTRHRSLSPMVESTRFCNYKSDKFSRCVSFTLPCWLGYKSNLPIEEREWVREQLSAIENIYFEAQERWGWDAQRASYFLPQGTRATIYLTAFPQDWEKLLLLRYKQISGPVRPDVLELSTMFVKILKSEGIDV